MGQKEPLPFRDRLNEAKVAYQAVCRLLQSKILSGKTLYAAEQLKADLEGEMLDIMQKGA